MAACWSWDCNWERCSSWPVETLLGSQAGLGSRWRKLAYGPITWLLFFGTVAVQFRYTNAVPERAFYFFCHHWPWFALGTAAYAAWGLRLVLQEGSETEL